MVRIEGAVVARGDTVMLGPVDLTLGARGITVFMGPNGAGKTTLLKLMHGLERAREGQVAWDGIRHEDQSFVFQRPILLRRSVRENVELPLRLRRDARPVEAIAEELGLGALMDTHAPRLSGGEAQKLALARALVTDPKVLFLDEPTANLDVPTVRAIEAVLTARAASGTRIFLSTHAPAQARRLASDIVWVEGGAIHGPFPAPDFFDTPPATAQAYLEDHG